MAKPIKSTPELTGHDADKFLRKMISVENSRVNYKQRKFAREIEENTKLLLIC